MIYTVHLMNDPKKEDALTLELLEAIEDRSDLSQRHLADKMGVALGLANSYLRRCARKGLIKIQHAPANRYLYYLTPKGFAEKSRLTGEYLSSSFDFYRKASQAYISIFEECRIQQAGGVCLCGMSELAEIASLRAREFNIDIASIFEPFATVETFLGKPVYKEVDKVPESDAYIFTALNLPEEVYTQLADVVDQKRIFVPDFLNYITKTNLSP